MSLERLEKDSSTETGVEVLSSKLVEVSQSNNLDEVQKYIDETLVTDENGELYAEGTVLLSFLSRKEAERVDDNLLELGSKIVENLRSKNNILETNIHDSAKNSVRYFDVALLENKTLEDKYVVRGGAIDKYAVISKHQDIENIIRTEVLRTKKYGEVVKQGVALQSQDVQFFGQMFDKSMKIKEEQSRFLDSSQGNRGEKRDFSSNVTNEVKRKVAKRILETVFNAKSSNSSETEEVKKILLSDKHQIKTEILGNFKKSLDQYLQDLNKSVSKVTEIEEDMRKLPFVLRNGLDNYIWTSDGRKYQEYLLNNERILSLGKERKEYLYKIINSVPEESRQKLQKMERLTAAGRE